MHIPFFIFVNKMDISYDSKDIILDSLRKDLNEHCVDILDEETISLYDEKMMNYYLPMTVKLLDAYEEMDRMPVQGENIKSSKKEIEDTLDTLNQAFEKLLDSVFQDTAWDVSSDISVLHTLLAQEGLTDDDFAKMNK